MNQASLIECRRISREFPGVIALDDVSLSVSAGEIVAIVGENGAGKSTLMKILAGVDQPGSGRILLDGRDVRLSGVRDATSRGIVLIHQELNLSDNLSVAANICLGREARWAGLLKLKDMRRSVRSVLDRVGLDVDPETPLRELAIGQQQLVEIARALTVEPRLLIMDEPTSSLSQREADTLFEVARGLRRQGIGIVYISHRLSEVRALADRVVVLRDGRNAGELGRDEITHDRMIRLMVGRDVSSFYSRSAHQPGPVMLEAVQVRTPAHPGRPVSFAVRAGEIVGIAGLVGSGRTELLECLFGIHPLVGGEIRIADERVRIRSPNAAVRHGLALVPEDRKQQGLILEMTVQQNTSLASIGRDAVWGGLIDGPRERAVTAEMIRRLRIRTPSADQIVQLLSGGNQQKVVLGRWLSRKPRVLMLDEPTRGIDVGAKQEIYELMGQLAGDGLAVLFVSSDMEEILGVADRVLVMHDGRIAGVLQRSELSEEAVMQLATGETAGTGGPV